MATCCAKLLCKTKINPMLKQTKSRLTLLMIQKMNHLQNLQESKPKTHNIIHTIRCINKTCIKTQKTYNNKLLCSTILKSPKVI
jgi:hypothetical protein